MELRETWKGLIIMLLIGVAAGILNVLLFLFFMNPLLEGAKEDEVAASTYAVDFFVGWVFFSAWFLGRADDELKKVEEAVHKKDREAFLIGAPKRIALSIRILFLLISALVILSFHLFHIGNTFIASEIEFGVGFLVVVTALVLWDLDSPIGGAITVSNIPEEWMIELHKRQQVDKAARKAEGSATI